MTAGTAVLWDEVARDFVAWRDGDRQALERLVRAMTPTLWHIARAYRLDRDLAEDVVQTVWLTLVRRSGTIQDPQALVRWLTVTVRREAWRCAQATRREDVRQVAELDLPSPRVEAAEDAVLRSARDSELWSALATLSERCQRLLRVVAFCERPDYTEISRELDMPVGSVGPTRGRCLERLRIVLDVGADRRST